MATLNAQNPTLLDLARLKDPNGSSAKIIEILNKRVDVLEDITFMEGNLDTGHRSTVRSGIPAPTFTKLYQRVQPTKGTTVQVEDTCAILEDYSEVAKNLADMSNNKAAWRLAEDAAHIEGFYQTIADSIFYSDEDVNPERMTGLAPRYNSLSADNAENIIVGGGSGSDNASIWLVVWGPDTCHGIVPKGMSSGLEMRDLGEITSETSDGLMQVYRTYFRMAAGLCLRDWRYVVRIPNIDRSALSVTWNNGAFSSGADITDLMFQATRQIPNLSAGRAVFYMDRQIETTMFRQASAKTRESTLTTENVGGQILSKFLQVPIKRVDALAGDEATVS